MAVSQEITLYNKTYTVPPVINAVQNDTDRQIVATLGDFTLASGMTAKLSFERPDKTHYETTGTVNTTNNTVTAELDQAMTQVGICKAQIKVTETDGLGSTFTFIIKVQPDVAGISVPQDGWSAQEFDQRLTDAENAIDAVEEDVADLQDKEYDYAPVITDTASGSIASFPDGADGYPLKECVVNIEAVQSGSGDPSPTNVRPISGWSSAKVTRTGKNLLDESAITSGLDLNINNGGTFSNASWSASDFIAIKGANITLSWESDTHYFQTRICYYDASKTFISGQNVAIASAYSNTYSLPTTARYVRFSWSDIVSSVPANRRNIRVNFGNTDQGYTPYVGQTVTISLGDTRYGAVLDVTRGKLRVTWGSITVNSFSGTAEENGFRTTTTLNNYGGGAYGELMCNMFTRGTSYLDIIRSGQNKIGVNTNGVVLLNGYANGQYLTLAEINALIPQGGCQLVYPLATPIEVDLTPTEITTLLGINNVWADCGDIEVEYCADTKKYIQKVISQLV